MKQRLQKKLFLGALEKAERGSLELELPGGDKHRFEGNEDGPDAHLILHSHDALAALCREGGIGLAEAYMAGECDSEDLSALVTYGAQNAERLQSYLTGTSILRFLNTLYHAMHPNTRRGSRKNIHAHYDLGNDFYELWLDPTMTYSSALYGGQDVTLEVAQHQKYGRILDRISSTGTENVLEIGCGWGGFAEDAASRGMHVTGLTLSTEQAAFTEKRMKEKSLDGRVDVALRDYRDEQGRYDSIVSIEMFEAVGEKYWPSYFSAVKQRLKEGGKAVIQTITIDDKVFPEYRKRCDFIQRHIFPGGMLPSRETFAQSAEKVGLRVSDEHAFGTDYAKTLSEWLQRFDAVKPKVAALGFSEEFIRKWRFYLAYCEGGFASERTDVIQYELQHA